MDTEWDWDNTEHEWEEIPEWGEVPDWEELEDDWDTLDLDWPEIETDWGGVLKPIGESWSLPFS